MIQFSLLGSGSSGNAILVKTDSSTILIDDGLSFKQVRLRAAKAGVDLQHLDAVFVTHEHSDHVNGLGTLSRKLRTPVYMTPATFDALPKAVGKLDRVELFEAGDSIPIDGLVVRSFSTSHDAADPVGYVVERDGVRLGLAADMGRPSQLVRTRLAGAHGLIIESNYCPTMLSQGSYPPSVQQRIRGRHGHLSNDAMSALLKELLHDALQLVVLAHISQENNRHRLAYEAAVAALAGHPARVFAGRQDRPTRLFRIPV